jgi:hypothetical protein
MFCRTLNSLACMRNVIQSLQLRLRSSLRQRGQGLRPTLTSWLSLTNYLDSSEFSGTLAATPGGNFGYTAAARSKRDGRHGFRHHSLRLLNCPCSRCLLHLSALAHLYQSRHVGPPGTPDRRSLWRDHRSLHPRLWRVEGRTCRTAIWRTAPDVSSSTARAQLPTLQLFFAKPNGIATQKVAAVSLC